MSIHERIEDQNIKNNLLKGFTGKDNLWKLFDSPDENISINDANKTLESAFMADLREAHQAMEIGEQPAVVAACLHISMLKRLTHFNGLDACSERTKDALASRINRELGLSPKTSIGQH